MRKAPVGPHEPVAILGREAMPGGNTAYLLATDGKGRQLSVHECVDTGKLWIAPCNERDDYRPIRLDPDQVRALRDACDLYLADRASAAGNDPS